MNQRIEQTTPTSIASNAIRPASRQPQRVAFIQGCWHRDIVDRAWEAFLPGMAAAGWPASLIDRLELPGVFELPLQAKRLAQSGGYAAIVAAGFVVNGGIYRHDFVSAAVIDGLMRVQLDTDVPVLSCVLTPHHFHEHDEHSRFFAEHFRVKGREVAAACARILQVQGTLPLAA